jgi:hypothetical protein
MSMARQQRMAGSAVFNGGGSEWWPTTTRGGFLQVGECGREVRGKWNRRKGEKENAVAALTEEENKRWCLGMASTISGQPAWTKCRGGQGGRMH